MKPEFAASMAKIYPRTRSHLRDGTWARMMETLRAGGGAGDFPELLSSCLPDPDVPAFLPDLARLEKALHEAGTADVPRPGMLNEFTVNPSLELVQVSWKQLLALPGAGRAPEEHRELVSIFRRPGTGEVVSSVATDGDLLALKIVVERISTRDAAVQGGVSNAAVDSVLDRAAKKGLLLAPSSKIRRDPAVFPVCEDTDESYLSARVFTLQWHITQACDLHCKHCYDRSQRQDLAFPEALGILEDLYRFCKSRNVKGQVSFTGGNPLLYPRFDELYEAASDLGFALAILGNPASRARIERILAVEKPVYYQVSLEGLRGHNDEIRGEGHYDRTMAFLELLRDLGIYAMVMLTLTDENVDQVILLAEELRGKADSFTFNRLSMVGEGARLKLPSKETFASFLSDYLEAAKDNPVIGLKESLLNIVRQKRGEDVFGGCAGYGCGAAFNFMSVLPEGEAHACRKFPSPIGNVLGQGIAGVYDSPSAKRYRDGSRACRSCSIRPVCGGCLAVSYSSGLDIFEERDPFCFMPSSGSISPARNVPRLNPELPGKS
ncbi:MAG: selenobiotic family peptide radical SAM maturase [Deltaproteobacteria bacterium]|nr:selenobiotic family peptide radical SAM maturase [Deltaproteobacteria bacterium]